MPDFQDLFHPSVALIVVTFMIKKKIDVKNFDWM